MVHPLAILSLVTAGCGSPAYSFGKNRTLWMRPPETS